MVRAGWLDRLWTQLTAPFELTELYEVGFSSWRMSMNEIVLRPGAQRHARARPRSNTMLSPRFYTTDFEAMDRLDVSQVRAEWDALIAEMRSDPNKGHFVRNDDWQFDLDRACRKACARSCSTSWSAR